ncbi:hypothetical protein ACLI4B_35080, partial [Pseudomonas aeruginosa]
MNLKPHCLALALACAGLAGPLPTLAATPAAAQSAPGTVLASLPVTHALAERLLRELAKPVGFAKQWLVITPSIGVALFPGDALQFGKLYKAAEQALNRV